MQGFWQKHRDFDGSQVDFWAIRGYFIERSHREVFLPHAAHPIIVPPENAPKRMFRALRDRTPTRSRGAVCPVRKNQTGAAREGRRFPEAGDGSGHGSCVP